MLSLSAASDCRSFFAAPAVSVCAGSFVYQLVCDHLKSLTDLSFVELFTYSKLMLHNKIAPGLTLFFRNPR